MYIKQCRDHFLDISLFPHNISLHHINTVHPSFPCAVVLKEIGHIAKASIVTILLKNARDTQTNKMDSIVIQLVLLALTVKRLQLQRFSVCSQADEH